MSEFEPWIRKHNYSQDYFWTVYKHFIETYRAYPINYYSMDQSSTVWDDEYLMDGSYDKDGVGEMSGVKWKKIIMLPVFGISQVQPNADSNENNGYSYRESLNSSLLIPQVYGLKPVVKDVIDMNYGFINDTNYKRAVYSITNVDLAHYGDSLSIYKCELKVSPFEKADIEKQLSTYWQFYEPTKTIIPLPNAVFLTRLLTRSSNLADNINNLFNSTSGYYLEEVLAC